MNKTKIQWADTTVNPVMGCDGCPLYPSPASVRRAVVSQLKSQGARQPAHAVESVLSGLSLTEMFHLREPLGRKLAMAAGLPRLASEVSDELKRHVRCYAAYLHMIRGANPRRPEKVSHKGHARVFEEITQFPGRMADVARLADLSGTRRPEAPWKDGLPRLIFVSDMGDALSAGVSFDYLKNEIIDVVTGPQGARHLWLWLTKRPARMLQFDRWLQTQRVDWPSNLVAMTSVMDRRMAGAIAPLRKLRAPLKGLSVEPLVEAVTLDLRGIDWVIIGGESGSSARSFHIEWALSLNEQCEASGTAIFIKQLGARPIHNGKPLSLSDAHGGDWDEWATDLRVREFPQKFSAIAARNAQR